MSQHDFEIANQTFPAFRSDLNNALQALVSSSAGASEPSTTFAYQLWYDSTNDLLKMRNADDDAWITLFSFNQSTNTVEVSGEELVDDTTPQLGGDLDVNGNKIVSTSNGNIELEPNGTGDIVLDGNVGIGTNSPDVTLELSSAVGTSTSLAKLKNSSAAATSNISRIDFEFDNSFSGTNVDVQIGAIKTNSGNEESAFFVNTTSGTGTPTERMRIDGSGNVGINEASPDRTLHVNSGSSNVVAKFESTDSIAAIEFADSGGSAEIGNSGNDLVFFPAGAERMRIDSSGHMLVGTTDNAPWNNSANSSADRGIAIRGDGLISAAKNDSDVLALNRTGSNGAIAVWYRSGSSVGSVSVTTSSTSYNTSSDHRLKENAVDLTGAITRVKSLQPKRFNFIADDSTTVDGFMAHEAATVVPEAVTGTHNETRAITNAVLSADGNLLAEGILQADWAAKKGDDDDDLYPSDSTWSASHTENVYQGIDQSKLVPLLTGALQEAIAKIEALETRVQALEDA